MLDACSGAAHRFDYASAALSAGLIGDQRADGIDRRPPGSRLAPHGADVTHGSWLGKGQHDDPARLPIGALGGKLRQQSDPGAGGDHLPQRLEAGRAKILALARADAAADLQRLVPQTVTLFEQEQGLLFEVGRLHPLALGEPVPLGHRHGERLAEELTRLELHLYEHQTGAMLEKLRMGELDLGILALPVELEGLEVRELYLEAFTVALPERHRLAKRDRIQAADLEGERLLLLEEGHCLRDQALEVCSRAGVAESQDFRATSLETLRQMVATGAGVTLLPELATQGAYGGARGVAILPFARPVPVRHVGAVWRKTTGRRGAIEAVCDLIAQRAGGR